MNLYRDEKPFYDFKTRRMHVTGFCCCAGPNRSITMTGGSDGWWKKGRTSPSSPALCDWRRWDWSRSRSRGRCIETGFFENLFKNVQTWWLPVGFCRKTGGNSSSLGDMVTGGWRTTPPSAGECKYYSTLSFNSKKNQNQQICPPCSLTCLFFLDYLFFFCLYKPNRSKNR